MHHCLGRPLPYQLANAPRGHPIATAYAAFYKLIMRSAFLSGISTCFQVVSQTMGQVPHVLLTHPPLAFPTSSPKWICWFSSLDLHVLGTPPAFVLSQDQTLVFEKFEWLLIRLFKIFVSNLLLANWLRFLFGFLHPHTFSETLFSFQSTTSVRLNQTTFIFYQTLKLLSRTFLNLFFCRFRFRLTTFKYVTSFSFALQVLFLFFLCLAFYSAVFVSSLEATLLIYLIFFLLANLCFRSLHLWNAWFSCNCFFCPLLFLLTIFFTFCSFCFLLVRDFPFFRLFLPRFFL